MDIFVPHVFAHEVVPYVVVFVYTPRCCFAVFELSAPVGVILRPLCQVNVIVSRSGKKIAECDFANRGNGESKGKPPEGRGPE